MSANTRERHGSGEGPACRAWRWLRAAVVRNAPASGSRSARAQSGQALILAVVIMLLLVFVGTLFLRNALSNLRVAEKSQGAQNEYGAAEAGIRFADTHLTSSELGADWRPRPSYNLAVLNKRLGGSPGNPAPDLRRDPDWYWIQPFDPRNPANPKDDVGGFVRYNLGDARFLLRVTYNPNNVATAPVMPDVDPAKFANGEFGPTALSRFIMIEAIGRRGSAAEIDQEYQDFLSRGDPIDPTVFSDANIVGSRARFRRELVAFKAIGINNYLRFVTDRDRLGRPTYLGVDQDAIRDGDPTGSTVVDFPYRVGTDADAFAQGGGAFVAFATGAPIRVNGDVVFYGNSIDGTDQPEFTLAWTDEPWNVLEAAGEIRREGRGQDPTQADPARMCLRLYPRYSGQTAPDP
ncbi:MAG: pilus assembly PilX N-terminal domain-containing protein, partial [Armatimonadota bacterium]|nr:pilus assembly PilX N-terminal domain-containing protein [Armatimonadota bacterium]